MIIIGYLYSEKKTSNLIWIVYKSKLIIIIAAVIELLNYVFAWTTNQTGAKSI